MSEKSGVGNLQTLKLSARATSKFKVLEPTKVEDLVRYHPDRYTVPKQEELETLTEGDMVQIGFINSEDLWVVVDSTDLKPDESGDGEVGTVYGKTCQQALRVHGVQKGQRVCFDVKCICKIRYHDDDDEDEEEDDE